MKRPNWYSPHPTYCTCVDCHRARYERRRPRLFRKRPSTPRHLVKAVERPHLLLKRFFWVILLATALIIIILALLMSDTLSDKLLGPSEVTPNAVLQTSEPPSRNAHGK